MDHDGPKLARKLAVDLWMRVNPVTLLEIDDSVHVRLFLWILLILKTACEGCGRGWNEKFDR